MLSVVPTMPCSVTSFSWCIHVVVFIEKQKFKFREEDPQSKSGFCNHCVCNRVMLSFNSLFPWFYLSKSCRLYRNGNCHNGTWISKVFFCWLKPNFPVNDNSKKISGFLGYVKLSVSSAHRLIYQSKNIWFVFICQVSVPVNFITPSS